MKFPLEISLGGTQIFLVGMCCTGFQKVGSTERSFFLKS